MKGFQLKSLPNLAKSSDRLKSRKSPDMRHVCHSYSKFIIPSLFFSVSLVVSSAFFTPFSSCFLVGVVVVVSVLFIGASVVGASSAEGSVFEASGSVFLASSSFTSFFGGRTVGIKTVIHHERQHAFSILHFSLVGLKFFKRALEIFQTHPVENPAGCNVQCAGCRVQIQLPNQSDVPIQCHKIR